MRLLLDIGNTRIKWAVQTKQGLSVQQAITHAGLSTAQLGTEVFAPCGQVTAVLACNVAGAEIAAQISQATRDCWQIEPQFVMAGGHAAVVGRTLRNAYAQPEQLGADRWQAMLGAYALAPTAALVVSVGTAMTLDAIDQQGQHLGGLIVPGPNLQVSSLLRHTSDLAERAQQVSAPAGGNFFADNTRDCIQRGALHSTCSLIDTAYRQLNASVSPQPCRLLLTGGAAELLLPHIHGPVQFIADLVLQGLAHHE